MREPERIGAPPRLLERDRELDRIERAIDRAREGAGELLLVEGPAGIGKTSLLAAAAERAARRGMRALGARATELEREFPFGAVAQLLEPPLRSATPALRAELLEGSARHAAPVLGFAGGGEARSGFATLNGLYWLVANLAEREPLLLTLDDAQWADHDSLRFLGFLEPRLADLPVLLLLAARPEEWDRPAPLAGTASAPASRPISPAPLSEAATARLLEARFSEPVDARFAAACHAATAGNPFYLNALVDELEDDRVAPSELAAARVAALRPPAVASAIVIRLARLGAAAAALARAVAVLGDPAATTHALRLAELEPATGAEAVDALVRAQILTASEDRLSFAHPITRNAVYGDISGGERTELHRRAVALLADSGAGPERLAAHLLAIAPAADTETVATLREAAATASGRGAAESTVAYLRRAVAEPPAEGQRAQVLRELGLAEVQGHDERGLEHLRSALDLSAEDPERHAETARELAIGLVRFTRPPEALDVLREELERDPGPEGEARLELEAEFASTMLFSIDQPLGELDGRLERVAERAPSRDGAGRRILISVALRLAQQGRDAARATAITGDAFEKGLLDDVGPISIVNANALITLIGCGALETAERWAKEGLWRGREVGDPVGIAMNVNMLSLVAHARGAIREAEATATDALHLVREHEIPIGHPFAAAAMVDALLARGETTTAWRELERDGLATDAPPLFTAAWLIAARGRLRSADGDHERALDEYRQAGDWFRRRGAVAPGITRWRSDAVDSLLALGRRREAKRLAVEDLELARHFGAPHSIGRATRAVALAGEEAERIERLREAAGLLEGVGARLEHARALVDLGAALRRSGKRTDAREPLKRGLELARSCGAVPLAERAYTELRATGARPRKVLRTGADALTPSERRVAEMAASGLTNREIAQRLFVTTKTVEFHLGQAYRKLEIGSRSELRAALGDGGRV